MKLQRSQKHTLVGQVCGLCSALQSKMSLFHWSTKTWVRSYCGIAYRGKRLPRRLAPRNDVGASWNDPRWHAMMAMAVSWDDVVVQIATSLCSSQ